MIVGGDWGTGGTGGLGWGLGFRGRGEGRNIFFSFQCSSSQETSDTFVHFLDNGRVLWVTDIANEL